MLSDLLPPSTPHTTHILRCEPVLLTRQGAPVNHLRRQHAKLQRGTAAAATPACRAAVAARTAHSMPAAHRTQRAASTVTRAALNPFCATISAGCMALAVSGAVPLHDIAFSLAWPAYLAAANALRFNSNASHRNNPPGPLFPAAWVKYYAGAAAVLALLLPGVACMHAAFSGSSSSSSSSTSSSAAWLPLSSDCTASTPVLCILGPHLYLTAMQILCEFLSSSSVTSNSTALLPRLLVPIGFNSYRMWVLVRWCAAVVAAGLGPWHVGLAIVNLGFWAYNLFVFLLLKVVPYYLDPLRCAV